MSRVDDITSRCGRADIGLLAPGSRLSGGDLGVAPERITGLTVRLQGALPHFRCTLSLPIGSTAVLVAMA